MIAGQGFELSVLIHQSKESFKDSGDAYITSKNISPVLPEQTWTAAAILSEVFVFIGYQAVPDMQSLNDLISKSHAYINHL